MSSRIVIALVVVALAAGAAGYYAPRYLGLQGGASTPPPATAQPDQTAAAPPAPRQAIGVEVAEVRSQPLERRLGAVGSLLSDEAVMLRPEIAGRLREIGFQEGQEVRQGDLLFRLDDDVARAELQQARANLALAQSKFQRSTQLQQQGFISQQARDEAENALRVERANVALAQAKLDKTVILAPFDGQLGLRNVSVGDYVTAGQDLVTLQAIRQLKVDFRLPEIYVAQTRLGQPLDITLDALPGERWQGVVTAISPLVDVAGRAIMLRARLDNPDGVLRPGMFARVNLLLGSGEALMVPETALAPRDNQQFVMRVVDDVVEEVLVRTGQRQRGMVEIVEGLQAGDRVIVAGLQKVESGSRVRATVVES